MISQQIIRELLKNICSKFLEDLPFGFLELRKLLIVVHPQGWRWNVNLKSAQILKLLIFSCPGLFETDWVLGCAKNVSVCISKN